ncbi:MAG: glycosyltransferase, partial [Alphaproteobacteria bacterium]|nr:glycosyltransferase [Alphaproteobacteria bacterium]
MCDVKKEFLKTTISSRVAVVVIGRNEGARLEAGLRAVRGLVSRIIYVDSGSTDNSVAMARDLGAEVVELDLSIPFTAARARNAGVRALASSPPEFVQFIDGDCLLQDEWLPAAVGALDNDPRLGAVAGRRREMFPERSIYNRLCDAEWDTPVGPARAVGGDALLRYSALVQVGGFRDSLIAGEEPEMCVRLRAAGWTIHRLPDEMTRHDAAMTSFRQWWRRTRRAGFAFAEGASLHGAPPEGHWRVETRRALLWGLVLPVLTLLGTLFHPAALLLLAVYPLQVL